MQISTERLLIRNFKNDDWKDLYEYLSLPETYLFEPGEPINETTAGQMSCERSDGKNFFAVELKSSNKMIGHLYFNQTHPEEFLTWELGYIFNPDFHNKGYCTEAAGKMIEYAFDYLHAHRIVAYCNPLNHSSIRVLEKIGMTKEGYFRKKAFFRRDKNGNPLWHDCVAYGMLNE